MARIQYKIDFLSLTSNQAVRSDCADITFFNNGTSTVILNSALRIPPNGNISFTANAGELDTTIYNISFTGAGNNLVTVFRKIYVI